MFLFWGQECYSGFVEQKGLDEDRYICYDYIAFNRGGKHEVDYLYTGDDFVREIWFYSSDRIDGNTPVKDACAVSILNKEQYLDFDYSQTMARFKTVARNGISRGMKGTFAHDYTTAGNPKHYKFRTTSLFREQASNQMNSSRKPLISDSAKIRKQDLLAGFTSSLHGLR